MTGGIITMAGLDYEAALHLGPETWELSDRGPRLVQRMRAMIRKCDLPDRPTRDTVMTVGDLSFRITDIRGDHDLASDWDVQGMRLVEKG